MVENDKFAAFARRIIRAYGKRVSEGDIEALQEFISLEKILHDSITDAVGQLREFGYSWTDIGQRLGMTRQAAQQRWGSNKPLEK